MNKISQVIIPAALLAALTLIAPLPARGQKPVMIGVAGPAVNLTYAYLTQDAGLWRKYGVDARVVLFESGSTLAMVARTGEVSFAINSGPTVIAARTQGSDSIMVAATVNTLPYSLITAKSITSWNQLKGKKAAI